jgi:hypothetical protein
MSRPPHSPWYDLPINTVFRDEYKYEAPHCATHSSLLLLHPSLVPIFSLGPCSQTPSVYALSLMWDIKFHTHTKQLPELWFCIF